jgi:hypothetical protein
MFQLPMRRASIITGLQLLVITESADYRSRSGSGWHIRLTGRGWSVNRKRFELLLQNRK